MLLMLSHIICYIVVWATLRIVLCHNNIWRLVVAVSIQGVIKGAVYSHTEQLWDHICQSIRYKIY